MQYHVFKTARHVGQAAAAIIAAQLLRKPDSVLGLATGSTPIPTYEALIAMHRAGVLDFSRAVSFNLDEYVGLPITHPASFRKYLWERFVSKLPVPPAAFFPVNGTAANLDEELARLEKAITENPIDVAFVGIGENGHLAFNDPPADFETERSYLVIELEEKCRKQQLGEGWFPTFDDVPKFAISMSVKQCMKAKCIINSVPDQRKAEAVKMALEGPVTNMCAASMLQKHADCHTFLDEFSASLLSK